MSRRLDEFNGIISGIIGDNVLVVLSNDENDYYTSFDRSNFDQNGIPIKIGEGFDFWVEEIDNKEQMMIFRPLDKVDLTQEDVDFINEQIKNLIDGDINGNENK